MESTPVVIKAKNSTAKQVHIIARYEIKRDRSHRALVGHVAYLVRSSDGKSEYCCTLINGKATGCTCPSKKPCYHMRDCQKIEAARHTVVSQLSAACPVDDQICPDVAAGFAFEVVGQEEFSEEVAGRWRDEELNAPRLTREQYVELFDPNYENCYV